jgi:hypothetical protein
LGAAVAEVARLSMTASRRLQLAAESTSTIGIAIRRWRRQTEAADFGQPTAAVTRWRVTALPVPGIRRARWQVELIRCRAGESADFVVEACDAKGRIALAADLVDRPVAAEARLSLSISTLILLASRRGNPWVAPVVPNTGRGFGIVGAEAFPRVPPACAQKRLGGELRLVSLAAGHHVRLKCPSCGSREVILIFHVAREPDYIAARRA